MEDIRKERSILQENLAKQQRVLRGIAGDGLARKRLFTQGNWQLPLTRYSITRLAVVLAFALLALRVHSWGAAIRTRYRIVDAPTKPRGIPSEWAIAHEGSHGEYWIAWDTDGVGTWDEFNTPQGAFVRPTSSVIVSRNPGSDKAMIRAAGSNAIAELEWSAGVDCYRYTAREGDPVNLADVFGRLRAAGKLDRNDFASAADLFAATSSAHFPDAAGRIRGWAIGDGVRNPSNIIMSFRPGYFYGAGSFEYLVTIAGTHGGLERSSTLGFAMATFPLPESIRVADVIPTYLLESSSERKRPKRFASTQAVVAFSYQ
jgi:hypothetical protein